MIYGDGEQSRDFTFVANAVHANLLAARSARPIQGEVLNVGCGNRVSVNQLGRSMAAALGRPDLQSRYAAERAGDIKHSFADLTLTRQTLGYEPVVAFEPGLRQTIEWYRSVL
jgi:nucleoside-diphosphate-sugar epimerase